LFAEVGRRFDAADNDTADEESAPGNKSYNYAGALRSDIYRDVGEAAGCEEVLDRLPELFSVKHRSCFEGYGELQFRRSERLIGRIELDGRDDGAAFVLQRVFIERRIAWRRRLGKNEASGENE
jgi:hypothetical protein